MPGDNEFRRLGEFKKIGHRFFSPFRHVAALRPAGNGDLAARLRRLEDELAVRDAFTRYHYFYDMGDTDAIAALFAQDAILVNPRGTYIGRDQVRANYQFLVDRPGPVFHYATNVLVRVSDDGGEAWLTAFLWLVYTIKTAEAVADPREPSAGGGSYAIRWRKVDGAWLISESRLTLNYRVGFAPAAVGLRQAAPEPDLQESSRDWLDSDPDVAWPTRTR